MAFLEGNLVLTFYFRCSAGCKYNHLIILTSVALNKKEISFTTTCVICCEISCVFLKLIDENISGKTSQKLSDNLLKGEKNFNFNCSCLSDVYALQKQVFICIYKITVKFIYFDDGMKICDIVF